MTNREPTTHPQERSSPLPPGESIAKGPIALMLGAIALTILITACTLPTSQDPRVAQVQQWAHACAQLGQAIQTATWLNDQNQLTNQEVRVIDKIDKIYRPICTKSPGKVGETIREQALAAAVQELCPGMLALDDSDLAITSAQLASCAAKTQLVKQLQVDP